MGRIVERAKELRKVVEANAEPMSDKDSLDYSELFPNWKIDTEYTVGNKVRYLDLLYRCIQSHTSQSDWTPDVTQALWVRVSVEEYPEWIQPTGSQDAYMIGDKVSHNENRWISTLDSNVWEPGVYGWDEVV